MKNYKIVLAYDGSRYNGWQKQGNTGNTVQEKLEGILERIGGAPTEIFGSGRTDGGTHAKGQVANFHMDFDGTAEALMEQINGSLSEDIAVLSIEEVDSRFHSRLSAKAKTYEYTIWHSTRPPVFARKYVFWCKESLDLEKMKVAAEAFLGVHDFKSFCANKRMKKSTVREIYDITFTTVGESTTISYTGNGFLYQMIRILTGTLIEVGEGKRDMSQLPEVLSGLTREGAGFTAPSRGLCLKEVFYEEGLEKA